ncbi:hypothetical protein CN404_27295 [Bacillus thuringiensis]|nr:hypothetical protein CN404_27295 [Bacillus thuringiensis]
MIVTFKVSNVSFSSTHFPYSLASFKKLCNRTTPVIPPRKNRKKQREYDKHLYKLRHLVENAFLKLKRFRGVATRYTKTTSAFRGAVTLASISQWLNLL